MALHGRSLRSLLFILLVLSCSLQHQRAYAFPTSAGACPEREAAVGGPHIQTDPKNITTGPLSKGSIQFTVNGKPLIPGEPITLPLNQNVPWELSSSSTPFRGYLLRLGGGSEDVDTTDAFSSPAIATGASQKAYMCFDVGGLTHTDASKKQSVQGTIFVSQESQNMPLDITVVIENRNGISTFYHSVFDINAAESTATSVPTTVTTGSPTIAGDIIPGSPTSSITISPTLKMPTVDDDKSSSPTTDTAGYPSASQAPTYTAESPSGSPTPTTYTAESPSGSATPTTYTADSPTASLGPTSYTVDSPSSSPTATLDPPSWDTSFAPTIASTGTAFPTSEPTPSPITYCGDSWAFGRVDDGNCYAWDSGFCVTEYAAEGCEEITQSWQYYNQLHNDMYEPVGPYESYATVSASSNTCTNECTLQVAGYTCSCRVKDRRITMEDCSNVTSGAIVGQFEYPQSIVLGESAPFHLTPTEAMCNHPSVSQQTDSIGIRFAEVTHTIPTTLTFFFKPGTGKDFDLPSETRLFTVIMEFMLLALKKDQLFKDSVVDVKLQKVVVDYHMTTPDALTVAFDTVVGLAGENTGSQLHATQVLGAAKWDQFIYHFVRQDKQHQASHGKTPDSTLFDHVETVKFKGIGRGS